jgi:hypothetical protein
VEAARPFVASSGINLERFRPAPKKQDVVLFGDKLDPRKAVGERIAVASALADVRLREPPACTIHHLGPLRADTARPVPGAAGFQRLRAARLSTGS